MAISYVGAGTAVYSTGNPAPTAPSHNVGDFLILAIGTKPDTTPATQPAGWQVLGSASGGTGSQGIDTGPMRVGLFYRVATGSGTAAEDNPGTVTITGNNISSAQIFAFRPGAGNVIDVAGVGAADTTTGTPFTAAMPTNPGITVGDMLFAVGVIPTDVTTPSQFSAETVSATGMTTVNLTEIGEWDTASGQDMGGWQGYGAVVTGTATGNPTVSATAGGTTTNVAGPIYLVRMRELPPQATKTASDSGTLSVTESASITVIAAKSASDSGTLSVTESASVTPITPPALDSYFTTADDNGYGTAPNMYKELTFNVNENDTIFAFGMSETGLNTGTPAIATQSGSTSAWTLGQTSNANSVPGFVSGRATATATGSVTIRATVPVATSDGLMFVGAYVLSANSYTGTPAFTNIPAHTLTGSASVNVTGPATVIVTACDWSALGPGTEYTPAGETVPVSFADGVNYGLYVAHWTEQTTGFRTYGPTAPSGDDWIGVSFRMEESAAATPVSASDSGTLSVTESASVAITNISSVSDSGTFSVTETSVNDVTSSRTDTGTLSVIETSSNAVSSSRTDSGTLSVTEAALITVSFTVSDSGTISVAESASAIVPPAVTYTDDFNRTNAIDLGTPWVEHSGDFSINSNQALVTGGSGNVARYNVALPSSDHFTQATFVSAPTGSQGVFARSDSGANSFYLFRNDGTTSQLFRNDGGSYTAIGSSASGGAPAGAVVRIEVEGTAIRGYINGTLTCSATDATPLTGLYSGIRGNDAQRWDDFSTGDLAPPATPISGSDSGTISATETVTQISTTSSLTETGTLSVIETSTNVSTLSRTDTGTFSVTETSTNLSTLDRTDTGSLSVTETAAVGVVVSSSDTGTLSVTETANVVVTTNNLSVSDSGTFTVTESSTNASTLARTDAGTISATDASTNLVMVSVSDSGTFSVTESVVLSNTLAVSDSGTISATDTAAVQSSRTLTDTGTLSVVETASVNGTASLSETATLSITDTAAVTNSFSGSDSGTLSVTEDAVIEVFGVLSKSGSDTGTLSVTETASLEQSLAISVSDSGTLSATETRSIASTSALSDTGIFSVIESAAVLVTVSRTDSGTLSVTESGTVFNNRPGADSGTFSVTESATVEISGLVLKSASDSGTISATDSVTGRGAYLEVSDTGTLSASDTSTSDLSLSVSDSGTVSAADTALVFQSREVSDSGTFSVTESATIEATTGTPVKVWNGSAFVEGPLAVWDGTQFVYPNVYVWNGTTMVQV